MITKETTISALPYTFKFRVVDDKHWIVTIDNQEEEWGLSSDYCEMSWSKGLADAYHRAIEFKPECKIELFNAIVGNSNIDVEGFIQKAKADLVHILPNAVLEEAKDTVNEWLDQWLHEDAIDVDPEDYEIVEPKWFSLAREYISKKLPGWKELLNDLPKDER